MKPEVSFTHTLAEISVNRADPCELVRELISNAYDAGASVMRVYALSEHKGLLFFDNGSGLSIHPGDSRNDILPYVAFFSIGKGTKTRGDGIGYKCQGAKLCFASRRFSVVTRTASDSTWLIKTIDNPKSNLNEAYDLTPKQTSEPWKDLRQLLAIQNTRTKEILATLDEQFFRQSFKTGTLIVIEGLETEDYETHFSTNEPTSNYLYQYIRLHTAHADARQITKEQGFTPRDIKAVAANIPNKDIERSLYLWIESQRTGTLREVPQGWMYLDTTGDTFDSSPATVPQLRSGRFFARHATSFKHGSNSYSLILAIDGNRRALDKYSGLGRRGSSNSGLKLSHTRGPLLSSSGIVVGNFQNLWSLPGFAESEHSILAEGTDHYTLIIDGPFDLVTNRDAPAPSANQTLRDAGFIGHLQQALKDFEKTKEGSVFAELIQRLKRETTRQRENAYLKAHEEVRKELPQRETFSIKDVPSLKGRTFFAPLPGEEHFVGALYTLFAHLVSTDHERAADWPRPLTFASRGIDALAILDETRSMNSGENVASIEYKYHFATGDDFNHPLNITNRIVCWDFDDVEVGASVRDTYNYTSTVRGKIERGDVVVGLALQGVRHANEAREYDHEVLVFSLRRLLECTFQATFTKPFKPQPKSR